MSINRKKLKITHGNYTIKKTHKKIGGDKTIYERDYTILNNVGVWKSDEPNFGSSTFKMVNNQSNYGVKKYKYGEWLKNGCNNNNNTYQWTEDCLSGKTIDRTENTVVLNPNYNSLLRFAYFGSCEDLVKTSIDNIIKTFPSQIYCEDGKVDVFNIDFINKSYEKYEYEKINDNGENEDVVIKVNNINSKIDCPKEDDVLFNVSIGDIVITCTYKNGKYNYSTTTKEKIRIRPKQKYIDEAFKSMSLFEQYMLNRDSSPCYTMTLDYSHEVDYGIETYQKKYTLPSIDGWNIDIKSNDFNEYVNSLLDLATFYDERQTGNLWRAMTHDAIKNMDSSFTFNKEYGDDDDFILGNGKMKDIIMVYGRQLDFLKLYADNIKFLNNISYTQTNNAPNYFLSDKLENSGWEVYSVAKNIEDSERNINFMKLLQLNSNAIFSRKGTKHGVDMLLSLFGLKSYEFDNKNYDYKVDEYVYVVSGITGETYPLEKYDTNNNTQLLNVEKFNSWKKTYQEESNESYYETDTLQGLPLRIVEYEKEGKKYKYVIPWFDRDDEIDGNVYFQSNGGWFNIPEKKFLYDGNEKTLSGTTENVIYDETIKQIRVVNKIKDLTLLSDDMIFNGIIYYVVDISDFNDVYNQKENEKVTFDNASHYFILNNVNYDYHIGHIYDEEGEYFDVGWENIPKSDIEDNSNNGFKVLYQESIVDEHKGNNPHSGNKYDGGNEYKSHFEKIFKYSIENDNFLDVAYDCDNKLNDSIKTYGFGLKNIVDNRKVHYFTDSDEYSEENKIDTYFYKTDSGLTYNFEKNGEEENKNDYTESAANSIINSKEIVITFKVLVEDEPEVSDNKEIEDKTETPAEENKKMTYKYLTDCVLPYLKQIIPSTAIIKIKRPDEDEGNI